MHALSLDDLMGEALKLGLTEEQLAKHQRTAQGSPKDSLVRLILRLPPRWNRGAEAATDEEMASDAIQPAGVAAATEDDY